jgi:hypothetical protein
MKWKAGIMVCAGLECQIRMQSQWNVSSIEGENENLPKVCWRPVRKSLIVASTSSTVPPRVPMKREVAGPVAIWGLISATIASGPISSMASSMTSAISVSASSHEMRSQRPSPRSPARRSGCRSRSAASCSRLQARPFWQSSGFMSGTPGSTVSSTPAASSRTTLPSFTNT